MELSQILLEFGRGHGGIEPVLDGDGRCALVLDENVRLIVDHRPAAGAVYLRIPFELPEAQTGELLRLYRRLLEANLLGRETGGAVFSLDEGDELLELHRRLALGDHLTPRAFADAVDSLYGVARHFAGELGLHPPPEDDDEG